MRERVAQLELPRLRVTALGVVIQTCLKWSLVKYVSYEVTAAVAQPPVPELHRQVKLFHCSQKGHLCLGTENKHSQHILKKKKPWAVKYPFVTVSG